MAPVTVIANTFRSDVLESDKPVLVNFWAEWCGPCRRIAPVLDEVTTGLDGKAVITKINVDEERAPTGMFQIMSIPSLLLFKDGKKVEEIRGVRPKGEITTLIEEHLQETWGCSFLVRVRSCPPVTSLPPPSLDAPH